MRSPLVLIGLLLPAVLQAAPVDDLLAGYAVTARQEDAAFTVFSGERGRQFFNNKHGGDWSCTSCHSDNPTQAGRHTVTGKLIEPLAPAANGERFTRLSKVEKWFKRNCNDVLERACTAREKGDVITYLRTLRP
jgi:hypothetical protein